MAINRPVILQGDLLRIVLAIILPPLRLPRGRLRRTVLGQCASHASWLHSGSSMRSTSSPAVEITAGALSAEELARLDRSPT